MAIGVTPRAAAQVQVNSLDGNMIGVHFDQIVSNASVFQTSNYTVFGKGEGIIDVTNVALQSDQQTVGLSLATNAGEFFAVAVSNIIDTTGNTNNVVATGFISDFTNSIIGTAADPDVPGEVVSGLADTYYVTTSGSSFGGTNDHGQFVYEAMNGDFDASVLVTELDQPNFSSAACLMARGDVSEGSPSVEICNASGTLSMLVRTNQDENAVSFASSLDFSLPVWLRMTSTSNFYTVYFASNGVDWVQCGSISLPSLTNADVGMFVTSFTNGSTTTAGFSDFSVSGARPGDGEVPTLKASIFQGTNLIVGWQRTPRDFAVQVATNLTSISSNSLNWAFLMFPIVDTSLVGTNAGMPTTGRFMKIPTSLFSNSPLFVRLAEVDRVIPDGPIDVTPGIILSQSTGNLRSVTGAAQICKTNVVSKSAVAATNIIFCPGGTNYQFTTAPSSTSLHTAILLENVQSQVTNCDATGSAGTNKSQLTLITPTNTQYSFVAAATTPTTNGLIVKVQINIVP